MNRILKNSSIFFLLTTGVCFATSAIAKYELPADYKKNEDVADDAVTEARSKTTEAVKSLQVVIKQFKTIVEKEKAEDKLVEDMLVEIRRLEGLSGSASGSQAGATANADWLRKVLAAIASEQGNGFKKLDKNTVSKILKAIEKNVPNVASDKKWAPILNAAKKAAK